MNATNRMLSEWMSELRKLSDTGFPIVAPVPCIEITEVDEIGLMANNRTIAPHLIHTDVLIYWVPHISLMGATDG